MPRFSTVSALVVCLGFTGSAVAWADPAPAKSAEYIEDPYAPHVTNGTTVRAGTQVGFIYGQGIDVLALGGSVAGGHRFNRLAVEAEYSYLSYQVRGPSSLGLGNGNRLGVIGRFDFARLGSRTVGENSMLAFYVEGGAAVVWNHWFRPELGDAERTVPDDSKRVEAQGGIGLELDHRLQEPDGIRRVGWFLGWRFTAAPHDADTMLSCRGSSCRTVETPDAAERYTDRSMLFQSSMAVTW